MRTPGNIIDDSAQPIPPRYWWTKRLGAALAGYLLLLWAVNVGGSWLHERRIDARVQKIHALGQPILLPDFDSAPPEPNDNAADFYARAISCVVTQLPAAPLDASLATDSDGEYAPPAPQPALDDFCRWRALVRARPEDIEQLMTLNAEALRLIGEADQRTRVDWGVRYQSPAINTIVGHLPGVRNLARLLSARALHALETGDHAAAVETVSRAVRLADNVGARPCALVGALVATACESLACSAIEHFGDLAIGPEPRAAPREQVLALIAQLLDESDRRRTMREGFFSERGMQLDAIQCVANGVISLGAIGPGTRATGRDTLLRKLARPLWLAEAVDLLDLSTAQIEALEGENWPAIQARWPNADISNGRPLAIAPMIAASLERSVELSHRALAERRMAAAALAIRLYEVDHGRRPDSLAELVPTYLPHIPTDPFSGENRALGYLPLADPPRLYSVGSDGLDQNGAYQTTSTGSLNRNLVDLPFFLDGPLPPSDPHGWLNPRK